MDANIRNYRSSGGDNFSVHSSILRLNRKNTVEVNKKRGRIKMGLLEKLLEAVGLQITNQVADKLQAGKNITEVHGDINININIGNNTTSVPVTAAQAQTILDQKGMDVAEILDKISPQLKEDLKISVSDDIKVEDIPWITEDLFESVATSAVAVLSTPIGKITDTPIKVKADKKDE